MFIDDDFGNTYKKGGMFTVENINESAISKISYGLYVVTTNDGVRDNGIIVNTVTQVTNTPCRIAVTIDKRNYSYETVMQTGRMNVNCLTVDAPFEVIERFGFKSGRDTNKFDKVSFKRSENSLAVLEKHINAYISLKLEEYVDIDTHGMFICSVDEAVSINNDESMTYEYYRRNVKPQPAASAKKGFVCTVCGYVYEADVLPPDFVCPLCKHPASDFRAL